MSQLTLNDDQRNALVRHLDRARVTWLVRREPSAHPGSGSGPSQLLARRGLLPMPASRRTVDDAEKRADRHASSNLEPSLKLMPGPPVHADLATATALAFPDQHRSAT